MGQISPSNCKMGIYPVCPTAGGPTSASLGLITELSPITNGECALSLAGSRPRRHAGTQPNVGGVA